MRTASKTPTCRLIDYSAPLKFDGAAALRKQIVAFVGGVRGQRQNPMTEAQIIAWFRSTPAEFVRARLTEVCGKDGVRCCLANMGGSRIRHDARYVYEVQT